MALGFSPLAHGYFNNRNKSKGGEIMTDYEIISLVILIASLVLNAIRLGHDLNKKK